MLGFYFVVIFACAAAKTASKVTSLASVACTLAKMPSSFAITLAFELECNIFCLTLAVSGALMEVK